jgi:hypothetical protein
MRRGAIDLLVNRLYNHAREHVGDIDFYIPQLCMLIIRGRSSHTDDGLPASHRVERLIIEMALDHPDLALKAL